MSGLQVINVYYVCPYSNTFLEQQYSQIDKLAFFN